jgi:hypothetical protein
MVRVVKSPGFDRKKVAFFMPSGNGPCRFGQYHRLHRLILDDLGYPDVPIYSPTQDEHLYRDLGMLGKNFTRLAWQGMVAIDLLDKKLRETRPYEAHAGETERVFQEYLKKLPHNDFATFRAEAREKPSRFWEHVVTRVITEDTESSFEKKITECLFAKTFREAGAADIGYAYCCYYDFPAAQAYNPKLKLIRTKTLMAGDDCCNPRHIWQA